MTILAEFLGMESTRPIDSLLTDIMDISKTMGQHHIKIDYEVDSNSKPKAYFKNLFDDKLKERYTCGVKVILEKNVPVYFPGIYAFSLEKSKTVYVGANSFGKSSKGNIYDRLLRFGRAIYDRLPDSESHAAGSKYRNVYGNNTEKLYLSFVLYKQIPKSFLSEMKSMGIKEKNLEIFFIRKFRSKFLLNTIV
jgi:hypothetical protein